MLTRTFTRTLPFLGLAFKYPIVSTSSLLFQFSYAKKEPIPTSNTIQVEKLIEPDLSLPQIYKAIESNNNIDAQIPLIKKWFQLMKKKKPSYDVNSFEFSRKIIKSIGYSKLDEVSFQNLYNVSYIYKYFLKQEIARNDPKIETAIYQSFLRKIEKTQLKQQNWKLVSKCYQMCSQLTIMNPTIHTKIPLLIIKALKHEKRIFDSQTLLNILNGLASRETHFKDERTAMVLIIAYFDKKYRDLDNQYKIRVVRELVDFRIQSRFGFPIHSQQKIFSHFLEELRANKFNPCSQHLINLLGKNTKSKAMQQITKIVVNESFELLNGKGELKQTLAPILFIKLVINLSATNKFSQLKDVQRAKLMEFLRKNISENKEDHHMQNQLGILISNSYFDGHHQILKLLIDNSKISSICPRLFFQVSRIGLSMKKQSIYLDSQARKNRLQAQQKMEKNDLIIFAGLGLQTEISPSNDYFKKLYDKYCEYFKNAVLKNGQKLLIELTRIPQTSLYHINRMMNFQYLFGVFESKQPQDRYFIRNALLYLIIKYDGIQRALSSVWFKQSQRLELVMQLLQQQLKSQQSTLHLSPNILTFLNQQAETYFLKNELHIYYCILNLKHIFTYLTIITKILQQNPQNRYQDAVYYNYWQLIFTSLNNNDKIYKQFLIQFKYRQLIDIMLNAQGHFTKTHQYNKFITHLLTLIPKMKPHYQTIARIIVKGISLGLVDQQNYAKFTSYINVDYDLNGKNKELVQFWVKTQQKNPTQLTHRFIKFTSSTRVFSMEQIKQEVLKYDENSLIKAIELFNLPLHSQSSKIYLFMMQQLKNKGLKTNEDINFVLILNKITKYLFNAQFSKEFNRQGRLFQIINTICTIHSTSFHKYTLEYHAQFFKLTSKLKVYSRNYERMILATLLNNSNNNVPMLISTITTLVHNEFRFNLKELKMIGQAMLSTKGNWKQTYFLLREKLQGLFEDRLKKQFEG